MKLQFKCGNCQSELEIEQDVMLLTVKCGCGRQTEFSVVPPPKRQQEVEAWKMDRGCDD